jgi:hypothetical protein
MKSKLIMLLALCYLTNQVSSQTCSQSTIDLVFVIDFMNIGTLEFLLLKNALINFIDNLNIGPIKAYVGIINHNSISNNNF